MGNTIFIAFIILLALVLTLYIALRVTGGKLDSERLKNVGLERSVKQLKDENESLRAETKLKSKLEKETNEKIDSLHTGDSVANAINGLSKHKDSDGGKGSGS